MSEEQTNGALRVYISVDMEGIAGVVHQSETIATSREYEAARKLMLGEVNASVEVDVCGLRICA